ncbi:MAG: chemotaxis protein CheW [Elainellaceae cyanobacterium]
MTSNTPLSQELDRQTFLTCPLADYCIAVPLTSILRVLRHKLEDSDDSLHRMGLLRIGSHVIRAINLHQWLTPSPTPSPPPFLIIVQSSQREAFGIWTDGLPNLVELSPDLLRSLPPSASAASKLLELMSYMAVIPGEKSKTIFLLNISCVLNVPAPEVASLPSQAQ